MRHRTTRSGAVRGPARFDAVSPLGLAAVAAVLHVAVLAGRVPVRSLPYRQRTWLAWQIPSPGRIEPRRMADNAPSKPIQSFCAGQLLLTFGMAVITLAVWLHIMRINGAHGP